MHSGDWNPPSLYHSYDLIWYDMTWHDIYPLTALEQGSAAQLAERCTQVQSNAHIMLAYIPLSPLPWHIHPSLSHISSFPVAVHEWGVTGHAHSHSHITTCIHTTLTPFSPLSHSPLSYPYPIPLPVVAVNEWGVAGHAWATNDLALVLVALT